MPDAQHLQDQFSPAGYSPPLVELPMQRVASFQRAAKFWVQILFIVESNDDHLASKVCSSLPVPYI